MKIHPTVIIHPNTDIDPSVVIEPYCIIGSKHGFLRLGPDSIIRSHSIIEGGSSYGPQLETGHHVLLRTGNRAGANLRIGTGSSLEGGGIVGDYVRIHGRCEMTEGELRDFSRLYANCYVTDVRLPPPPDRATTPAIIDEGAVLTIGCVVVAGVRVGVGSFVGANTTVTRDVPDGMALVGGRLKPVTELRGKDYAYPWTGYLRDGYPPEAWPRIEALHERIMHAVAAERLEASLDAARPVSV
jgi:acetyltransferase-like isoleucine patch superfamily enzyme